MSLESMKCPECGAQLHFSEEQDYCFCSHCGTQIYKDSRSNISIKKTIIHRNEAKILEAENKIKEYEYKERLLKRKFRMVLVITALIVIAIISIIIGLITMYKTLGQESFITLMCLVAIVIMFIAVGGVLGLDAISGIKKK